MLNTESFVFYESFYRQLDRLRQRNKEKEELNLYRAITEFGLYGTIPDEQDDVWLYGFDQIITAVDRAKDRYTSAATNGKKGGRPSIMLNEDEVIQKKAELGTWKNVASYYGITDDTLRKYRNIWEAEKPKNPKNLKAEKVLKTEKPKNLNVNVNVNENKNENEDLKTKISPSRANELREMIGEDGSYNGTWFDVLIPDFYDCARSCQISKLREHFPEFSIDDTNFILNEILHLSSF